MPLLPSTRLCLLAASLLLSLLVAPTNGQITSWSQVSILSLSSANCTQSGSAIINCPLPVTLTIVTSGWGTLPTAGTFVTITGTDGTELGPWNGSGSFLSVSPTDGGSNTTLIGTVYPQQYTPTLMAASTTAVARCSTSLSDSGTVARVTAACSSRSSTMLRLPSFPSAAALAAARRPPAATRPVAFLPSLGSGFRWFSNGGSDVDMWINGQSLPK